MLLLALLSTLALAGTVEIEAPPGIVVVVDGVVRARETASGHVWLDLPGGTHEIKMVRLFGASTSAAVEVPASGHLRVWLEGGALASAAAGAGPQASPPFEIPARAVRLRDEERGWRIPVRFADGTEVLATFDTGATKLGLCPELARTAGFVATETMRVITPAGTFHTPSGRVTHIDLLGHRVRGATAIVYPDLPCTTVMLGMQQLAHLEAVLRDGDLWVWIGEPRATTGSRQFHVDATGTLASHLEVNGRRVAVTVDTGASHLVVAPALAEALGAQATGESSRFEDAGGVRISQWLLFPELRFAGFQLNNLQGIAPPTMTESAFIGRNALVAIEGAEWRFSRGEAALHPLPPAP